MINQSSSTFIEAADKIGEYLCKKAFWAGSRCNWIGRHVLDNSSTPGGPIIIANHSLGPELYDGTSGIALFFAYLYILTKNEDYHRTALGAITHALSHIGDIWSVCRFGMYDGNIGVAYAAIKIGNMLGNYHLVESGHSILNGLISDIDKEHLVDIISGNAGAILAILDIYELLGESSLFEMALKLGNELLSLAVRESVGWSWRSNVAGMETSHNLTGFSHGAAGIGFSLLELFNKSDIEAYKEAAKQAFAYENYWFDENHDNWPDFRTAGKLHDNTDNQQYAFTTAWCHGAPGIALSRLRAYHILKDEKYLKDCHAALRATTMAINSNESDSGSFHSTNFSLCHGLAGNSEPLIYADEVFRGSSYQSIACDVGIAGIEKYGKLGSWPCGIQTGETPSLMLGLAGIGYFYLRLHDAHKIPSILMVTPP
jgi:lantibiotic biosynthesis protein